MFAPPTPQRNASRQNYFEAVSELLIEKPLRRASPGNNLSTLVRAQTLWVLEGLDPDRKRIRPTQIREAQTPMTTEASSRLLPAQPPPNRSWNANALAAEISREVR